MKLLGKIFIAFAMLLGLTSHAATIGCPTPTAEINSPSGQPLNIIEGRDRNRLLYEESHALLIGESNYAKSSGWRVLSNIPAELDALASALQVHGFHIVRYDDLQSPQLLLAIECFVKAYGYRRDARIVIYFTGHGFTRVDKEFTGERNVGYVLPVDAPPEPKELGGQEEAALISKALRLTQFQEWADAMEARHVLFLFDSCFSGAVLGHKGGNLDLQKPEPLNYILGDTARSPVRWFLTAGTASQKVPAQSIFNSLLVQALIGLRPEADASKDGFLTSRELVNYLMVAVPSYNPNQTPDEGKIRDPLLDVGDMVFQLPNRKTAAEIVRASNVQPPFISDQQIKRPPIVEQIARLTVARPVAPVVLESDDQSALKKAVQELESKDTATRRNARGTLAKLIGKHGAAFVGELVRGLPNGSYRFQLGVADALSNSPGGWLADDQNSALRIVQDRAKAAKDVTLKKALNGALHNARTHNGAQS